MLPKHGESCYFIILRFGCPSVIDKGVYHEFDDSGNEYEYGDQKIKTEIKTYLLSHMSLVTESKKELFDLIENFYYNELNVLETTLNRKVKDREKLHTEHFATEEIRMWNISRITESILQTERQYKSLLLLKNNDIEKIQNLPPLIENVTNNKSTFINYKYRISEHGEYILTTSCLAYPSIKVGSKKCQECNHNKQTLEHSVDCSFVQDHTIEKDNSIVKTYKASTIANFLRSSGYRDYLIILMLENTLDDDISFNHEQNLEECKTDKEKLLFVRSYYLGWCKDCDGGQRKCLFCYVNSFFNEYFGFCDEKFDAKNRR